MFLCLVVFFCCCLFACLCGVSVIRVSFSCLCVVWSFRVFVVGLFVCLVFDALFVFVCAL